MADSATHIAKMDSEVENELLNKAADGDRESLGVLMYRYADRLERIVKFRMDHRMSSRLDATDVVQESFVEATKRFAYYLENRKSSFFLWLRFLTLQKLSELHRFHLGAQARDQRKEISMFAKWPAEATSANIAAQLMGDQTSPSQAYARDEARIQIERALATMDEIDQEVLALRHFEQLSNAEVAESIGLSTTAASKRFLRAIQRLKSIVDQYEQ